MKPLRLTTSSKVSHSDFYVLVAQSESFPFCRAVYLKKYNIGVKFVTSTDPADFAAAIDENTKAIYVESIGNPGYTVADLPVLSKVG